MQINFSNDRLTTRQTNRLVLIDLSRFNSIFNPPCWPATVAACFLSVVQIDFQNDRLTSRQTNDVLIWSICVNSTAFSTLPVDDVAVSFLSVEQIDSLNHDWSTLRQTNHVDSIDSSRFVRCHSWIDSLWVYWTTLFLRLSELSLIYREVLDKERFYCICTM